MRPIPALALVLLAATPASAAEHTVTMSGMSYAPRAITAKVGDFLRFLNDDSETHQVFVPTKGFGVDLGTQKSEQALLLKLMRAGTFEVECVLHPDMLTRVTVAP